MKTPSKCFQCAGFAPFCACPDGVTLYAGDCLDVLPSLVSGSISAVVTDPPYGLGFMGKAWDSVVPSVDVWRECFRLLKPGGHVLSFAGTRTQHKMATAIEAAGFEIRDMIAWLYGSGFPKSLDVSKAIDSRRDWGGLRRLQSKVRAAREAAGISQSEAARRMGMIAPGESLGGGGFMWFETGKRIPTRDEYPKLKAALDLDDECDEAFEAAERDVIGEHAEGSSPGGFGDHRFAFNSREITAPATDAAKAWAGWGTALKPAFEPITVARKPLDGTVAANVLAHGTGAINVDACRIEAGDKEGGSKRPGFQYDDDAYQWPADRERSDGLGRWPANVAHDGSEEVEAGMPEAGGGYATRGASSKIYGGGKGFTEATGEAVGFGDSGSASRFFYCAKASDREILAAEEFPLWGESFDAVRNDHPTVKPLALMTWLLKLVTPPGGVVLDPFAGSGTTLVAARDLGIRAVGVELETRYCEIAAERLGRKP